MRCAARVATRCADGQLDGGWVDGDAPGIGASNGIGPKVAAPHALFLALGGGRGMQCMAASCVSQDQGPDGVYSQP